MGLSVAPIEFDHAAISSTAMTYGYPPSPPQGKPPMSGADLGISIAAIVFTVLFGAFVAFIGIFSLAFLDTCPPATCSAGGAVTAVLTTVLALAGIGIIGIVLTIIALVRRKRAWPYAIGMFGLCVLACVAGTVGYVAATGMTW
jgi:hypothetical protein